MSISPVNLDPITQSTLHNFDGRRKLLLVVRAIAAAVCVFVAVMMLITVIDYLWLLSDSVRWGISVVGYALTFTAAWFFGLRDLRNNSPDELAKQIESTSPRLRDDLLSAVELADPNQANGSPEFNDRLQGRVSRRVSMLDVRELLPLGLVRRWLSTGVIVAAVCLLLMLIPSVQFGRRFARAMLPGVPIERASRTHVTIIEPSPATTYVAEGDAVGIVVEISGEQADEVRMVWRNDDGVTGEMMMSPRVRTANQQEAKQAGEDSGNRSALAVGSVYAANLSVGTVPVQYQIHAGDAITLWNELTPLPRPRTNLFKKRYVFPTYAKLNDRVEEDEHGDLKAFIGTMANVTVRFDEPVKDAVVRYGNRGAEVEMKPADETGLEYMAAIPVKTSGSYQVDAVSAKSGLNNPFSPTYTITPVIDSPPVVRWQGDLSDMTLVSPLTVMNLVGSIQDDMPLDRVIHEYRLNGGAIEEYQVPVDQPSRQFDAEYSWDLMRRDGRKQSPTKLSSGDVLQIRLVAIDRRGNRGESESITLLITDEGFKADRHDGVIQLAE